MAKTSKQGVRFPNLRSRILLGKAAESQPIVDKPFSALVVAFLDWYERKVLKVDIRGIDVDRPIFLVGLPRSGTTMIQDILCAHESVAYLTNAMQRHPRHLCAVEDIRRRLKLDFETDRFLGDSVRVSPGSPSDATALWAKWFDVDPFSLEYRERKTSDFSEETIADMKDTIRRITWFFGGRNKRFFSKLLVLFPHLSLVNELFPDAKLIHMVRDPRLTANSMLKLYRRFHDHQKGLGKQQRDKRAEGRIFIPYPRFPGLKSYAEAYGVDDIRTTAHLWNEAIDTIDAVRNQMGSFCEVRYEDVLSEPRATVQQILDFCELPPARPGTTPFWEKLSQIGELHHANRYNQFEKVEEICGEKMGRFGYLR
jgi:hypothetical protein